MPEIMHLVKIHAAPDQVYRAITTAEGIRNWWTHDATLDSNIGGVGEFGFFEHQSITKIKIENLKPPVHVSWKTISSFRPEWLGTTITFDLQEEGSDTVLSLAHRGFKQADEGYELTKKGWSFYLVSLQQYLETGKGTPR